MSNIIITKIRGLKPIHYIIIFAVVVLYFGAMFGIINYKNTIKNPPKLEVTSPQNGDSYTTSDVLIQGNSEAETRISAGGVTVDTSKDGAFNFTTPLVAGKNDIKITATKNGKTSEAVVSVTREVPKPVVKKVTPPKNVTKTAKPAPNKLNNSGPETFWLFETGSITAAAVAWQMSKKNLDKARKK